MASVQDQKPCGLVMSRGQGSESWGDRAGENSCPEGLGQWGGGQCWWLQGTMRAEKSKRASGPMGHEGVRGGGREKERGVVNPRGPGDRTRECHTVKLKEVDLTQKERIQPPWVRQTVSAMLANVLKFSEPYFLTSIPWDGEAAFTPYTNKAKCFSLPNQTPYHALSSLLPATVPSTPSAPVHH